MEQVNKREGSKSERNTEVILESYSYRLLKRLHDMKENISEGEKEGSGWWREAR